MQPTDSDFLRELLTVFAAEADERIAAIDRGLLALERLPEGDERAETVAGVLRELHTLKGSAGAVDMPQVSQLAHALEGLLGGVQLTASADPALFDRAGAGLEALRILVDDSVNGRAPSLDVDQIIAGVAWSEPDPVDEVVPTVPAVAPSPPPAPVPTSVAAPRVVPDETIRLSTTKLDSLMARVGELVVTKIGSEHRASQTRVIADQVADWEQEWRRIRPQYAELRSALEDDQSDTEAADELLARMRALLPLIEQSDERVTHLARELGGLRAGVDMDERRLSLVTSELEEEVRRTRMVPVATVFDPLQRLVRDLARDLGKGVELVVQGAETEVDRSVLEAIRAPLTHLIRNAVDHGLEVPAVRVAQGKPPEGTIRLAAAERGGTLIMSLADDGAGIDLARIRRLAAQRGLAGEDQLRAMPDRDVLRLIFRPGFSTSETVNDISGRGVGLDAVREAVERLHGGIDVASDPQHGTTFTLSLPLSVATTQCVLVRESGHLFAIPVNSVVRLVNVDPEQIGRAQGREMIALDDGPVIAARLEDVLQITTRAADAARMSAVIVGAHERRVALLVEDVVATQDVVVKPLPRPFARVRHAAGATVLGTGDVAVVLNVSDLMRTAMRTATRSEIPGTGPAGRAAPATQTVLVVDDSIVTRMLEKSILEAAGYVVRVAADGDEAWGALQDAPVDLVVSDINMPGMDGLALTARIRADQELRATPVVLVTSLDAPEDHSRALDVGADAYIVKSNFSQEGLLETVGRLI